MNKNLIIVLVIAIVAIAAIVWLSSGRQQTVMMDDKHMEEEMDSMMNNGFGGAQALKESNYVYLVNQPRGNTITVDQVGLAGGGFVVIHEETNGAIGAVLGTSDYLGAGEHKDIKVVLVKGAALNDALYAMLHSDNGDQGFNPANDLPILNDKGIVLMRFFIGR